MKNPFKKLTKFELLLWITSAVVVCVSFALSPDKDPMTLCASLIGVTALIFIAKGYVIGQVMCVGFSVIYGIISFRYSYYGEMITYLCMSAPIAVAAVVSWIRHPYKDTAEVTVSRVTKKRMISAVIITCAVTFAFYFILRALGTANLVFSTVSVATSFLAAYLTFLRSPYYGLAYGANDIVLIGLWAFACISNIGYLPVAVCFACFFINDIYGFVNWKRMKTKQSKNQ
jgi:nicotinamide mononucleotide transporter PnuC